MEPITWMGLIVGIGGVLAGNLLEGGQISSMFQGAAFVIVFGGTFGAVMVANRRDDLRAALRIFPSIFRSQVGRERALAQEIVEAAQVARRESILALEARLPKMSSDFMRSVFRFLIDGVEPDTLRDIFKLQVEQEERRSLAAAKVWQDAGGFAPTIGILGAVLGLIQVMANLSDTSALGQGIAVAFVATIYGVGSANLIFIPIANKISRNARYEKVLKLMIVEGASSIVSGLNPYVIDEKLRAYFPADQKG